MKRERKKEGKTEERKREKGKRRKKRKRKERGDDVSLPFLLLLVAFVDSPLEGEMLQSL